MVGCFDRSAEKKAFINSDKNVIFFVNAHGNGMSTFLYNVLNNKQYIFLRENDENKIVLDFGDRDIRKFEKTRRSFLDFEEKFFNEAKSFMNLFYLVPSIGSFLRNVGIDINDRQIKKLNKDKYSFEAFLSEYISTNINRANVQDIYLIIDHADNCTYSFLYKLLALLKKWDLKLIFCLEAPAIKAEFQKVFSQYLEIDFSKPIYEDALIIFENLNMDATCYSKEIYENCNNIYEFISIYQSNKRNLLFSQDNNETIILQYLIQMPCAFGKKDFDILCQYLTSNACTNQSIDPSSYIDLFIQNGIITEYGSLFRVTEVYGKQIDLSEIFIAFLGYALSFYKDLSYEFLFFIFKTLSEYKTKFITEKIIVRLLDESILKSEIQNILQFCQKNRLEYSLYLQICQILFRKQLYESLYIFEGEIPRKLRLFNKLLNQIIMDKKHFKINTFEYQSLIKRCMLYYNSCDLKCIIGIIYLDFCINHNKKKVADFLYKKSIYYYRNFENSKYYYKLESIIAFYIEDEDMAINLYYDSIGNATGITRLYLTNNQFAFYLARFANKNQYIVETEATYLELVNDDYKWVIDNPFLNTNLMLFESIKNNCNRFNINTIKNETLMTWDLYKIINSSIVDFVYDKNFEIDNYIGLEKMILETHRAPAQNLYYYNLYVMAVCLNNKKAAKHAKHYLDHNNNFKHSNISNTYRELRKTNPDINRTNARRHVRFGYIFSRLVDMDPLFEEIAVFNR